MLQSEKKQKEDKNSHGWVSKGRKNRLEFWGEWVTKKNRERFW